MEEKPSNNYTEPTVGFHHPLDLGRAVAPDVILCLSLILLMASEVGRHSTTADVPAGAMGCQPT